MPDMAVIQHHSGITSGFIFWDALISLTLGVLSAVLFAEIYQRRRVITGLKYYIAFILLYTVFIVIHSWIHVLALGDWFYSLGFGVAHLCLFVGLAFLSRFVAILVAPYGRVSLFWPIVALGLLDVGVYWVAGFVGESGLQELVDLIMGFMTMGLFAIGAAVFIFYSFKSQAGHRLRLWLFGLAFLGWASGFLMHTSIPLPSGLMEAGVIGNIAGYVLGTVAALMTFLAHDDPKRPAVAE